MSIPSTQSGIFEEGRNCRRVLHAGRVAFVVDGDDYFKIFARAAERAREQIIILAWDFNSRCCLRFGGGEEGPPAMLGDFLNYLARRRRGLHIYVLDWDFPMIYAQDREAPVAVRMGWGWKPHRRVHLQFDNTHPPGGSHHQKIIAIDDELAFCGGLDLTCQRWDTAEHAPNNPHRVVADKPYPPFHDLMIAVDGAAARELARIARERWKASTGDDLPAMRTTATEHPWPDELEADIKDLPVAIAVTAPDSEPHDGKREIEALYLDMIARAKRYIYIENQYFTAHKIGEALRARLLEPGGPEIFVVTRLLSHGWLEEYTMGVLRSKLVERLREADTQGRFHVCYPEMPGLAEGTCIDVHSKMMAVDDEWLRIGSANLANRSMGIDTECDVALEAGGRPDVVQAIRRFRDQLLAEHLGVTIDEVAREIDATGSMGATVKALTRPGRTLKRLEVEHYSEVTLTLAEMSDPEDAVGLGKLQALFSFGAEFHELPKPVRRVMPYVTLAAVLVLIWRFTPLERVLGIGRRESAAARLWKKLRS